MEEGDLLVLRVTIGVSFALLPLLNKSNQGSFSFFYCFCSINLVFLLFLCGNFAFISHFEPKNILEAEGDSYWLLAMQEESSINLSATKFGTLFLDLMIDQPLILNGSLGTSWMSRAMLLGIKLG